MDKVVKTYKIITFIIQCSCFLTKIISYFNLFPYFCDMYHSKKLKPIETHYA